MANKLRMRLRRLKNGLRDELNYWVNRKNQQTYERLLRTWPPLVIGGTGGSGTRVLVNICEQAGYYSGSRVNFTKKDAMETHAWVRKWLASAIMKFREDDPADSIRMNHELMLKLVRHRRGIPSPSHPWVVKNPRLMLVLPYLHNRLPNMKFLHVVRDGRDMAFSTNQKQLRFFGDFWLTDDLVDATMPERSIAFWAESNLEAAKYGQSSIEGNYLRIRFEDLCREPRAVTARILAFLECDADADAVAACVQTPESVGRWREETRLDAKMLAYGAEALEYFGFTQH